MKKLSYISIVVFILAMSFALNKSTVISATQYKGYTNARFGYHFDYPAKFKVVRYPDNGDGVSMKCGKTELSMYGSYNPFNLNVYTGKKLKKQYKSYGIKMKNVKVTKRSLYYESKENGKISINYHSISKKYGVDAGFTIVCSKKNLKKYRKIANKMKKTCRFSKVYYS